MRRAWVWVAEHRWFAAVFVVGAGLRGLAMAGYRPALWFPDTYTYVVTAIRPRPDLVRPAGYSMFLRLLEPLHSFAAVAFVQHVLGLVTGLLVYTVARRMRAPVWASVLASTPVLLDAYQVELEHLLVSDTLFMFLVTAAVCLALPRIRGWRRACGVGLLLAAASLTRTVGLPLLAVMAAWILLRRPARETSVAVSSEGDTGPGTKTDVASKEGTVGIETPKSQAIQTETAKPGDIRAEASKPQATQAETTKPRTVGAEGPKPQVAQTKTPKPQATQTETAKPRTVRAETPKPQAAQTKTPKPRVAQAETAKPREVRAGGLKQRVVLAGVMLVAALVPLLAYAGWFYATYQRIGIVGANGVFLYGRTMSFADCARMRPPPDLAVLCDARPPAQRPPSQDYIWSADSPLVALPGITFTAETDGLAGRFAVLAIRTQPLDYAASVLTELGRTFTWGRPVYPNREIYELYEFPERPPPPPDRAPARVGAEFAARYERGDITTRITEPYAGWLRAYQDVIRLPGMALLAVLLAAPAAAAARRARGNAGHTTTPDAVTGIRRAIAATRAAVRRARGNAGHTATPDAVTGIRRAIAATRAAVRRARGNAGHTATPDAVTDVRRETAAAATIVRRAGGSAGRAVTSEVVAGGWWAGAMWVLPWGMAWVMLVTPAAVAEFDYRYVLPAAPLACLAAALAVTKCK